MRTKPCSASSVNSDPSAPNPVQKVYQLGSVAAVSLRGATSRNRRGRAMTVDRASNATPLPDTVAVCGEVVRTDRQLLEDYVLRHDEAALEALVRRHAPMVWGVCRRTLFDHHDAEDAFQATFLVLVRRAGSIASPELLAGWLYGVACQTALKARAAAARKRGREKLMAELPEPAAPPGPAANDLQTYLDGELKSLPDKYRAAIVLCDVEGKTRREAARELDWPEGTVAGRLAR